MAGFRNANAGESPNLLKSARVRDHSSTCDWSRSSPIGSGVPIALPSRKPARLNSHATVGQRPTPRRGHLFCRGRGVSVISKRENQVFWQAIGIRADWVSSKHRLGFAPSRRKKSTQNQAPRASFPNRSKLQRSVSVHALLQFPALLRFKR